MSCRCKGKGEVSISFFKKIAVLKENVLHHFHSRQDDVHITTDTAITAATTTAVTPVKPCAMHCAETT